LGEADVTCFEVDLEGMMKIQKPVRMVGIRAEIRTLNLVNRKRKC
jgi:hypothetical protein